MIVIGLTGKSGAGKDAVADILVRDHGFTKLSFAGPVKQMARDLDPIVGYDVYTDCTCGTEECGPEVDEVRLGDLYALGYDDETIKETPWGDEIRDLWQRLGTDAVRAQDPNFWVDQGQINLLESESDRVVFTDVRFPNEAEMIYNLSVPIFSGAPDGGLYFSPFQPSVWQVTRPDLEEDDHESESHSGLLDEEIQIHNSGTLEDLAEPVRIALGYVLDNEIPGQGLLGIALAGAADE